MRKHSSGLFLLLELYMFLCVLLRMLEPETRDQIVVSIRPTLELKPSVSPIEAFQNTTLRPILKFQNELLIAVSKAFVHKYQKTFNNLKKAVQEQVVKQAMKQDPELRNTVINMVVGMFTAAEYETYLQERAEYNKRITTMASERVLSQLDMLY